MLASQGQGAAQQTTDGSEVGVPACYSVAFSVDKNPIRQLLRPLVQATVVINETSGWEDQRVSLRFPNGDAVRLITSADRLNQGEAGLRPRLVSVLRRTPGPADIATARWIGNVNRSAPADVLESLDGAFAFLVEDRATGRRGLRLLRAYDVNQINADPILP